MANDIKLQGIENFSEVFNNQTFRKVCDVSIELYKQFGQITPANAETTYKVTFPKGISGHLMQTSNGLTTAIVGDNGKIVGQAALTAVESTGVVGIMPIFVMVSVATCFEYLDGIREQLNGIQVSINKVLEFLNDDKICSIFADAKTIEDISKTYDSIMKVRDFKISSIGTVRQIKTTAEKNIQFYKHVINRAVGNIKGHTKEAKAIDAFVSDVDGALDSYNQSINLYGVASVMEVMLTQCFDDHYLSYVHKDLDQHSKEHVKMMQTLDGNIDMLPPTKKNLLGKEEENIELTNLRNKVSAMTTVNSQIAQSPQIIANLKKEFCTRSDYYITAKGEVYEALENK